MIEFPQDLPEECVLNKHSSFLCLCQMSKHLSQVDAFNKCGFIPESLIVSLLLATFNSTFYTYLHNQALSKCKRWRAVTYIMVFCPLQKTQDKGATPSLPRTTCRNSSTCCIPAQPDSPSSWTDCEKVRMLLTTLSRSLVGHTFCHFDGHISQSSGQWHAWTKPAYDGWSCCFLF